MNQTEPRKPYQTNILYTLNRTGKNLLRELPTQTINGVTLTNNGDGTYTITRTATSTSPASFIFGNNNNGRFTGCKMTGGASGYGLKSRTSSGAPVDISTNWTTAVTISAAAVGDITVNVESSENPQNVQIRPFVCDAEMYAKDPSFTMPALPNSDLTYLEAEDRAALAEEIDAGAKQLAQGLNNSGSAGTATIQSDGYTVKLTGSAASSSSLSFAGTGTIQKTGTYVFAIEASGTLDRISIWDNTASASVETLYATGSKEVTLTAGHSYALFHFAGSAMTLNATVKYMICTKAAFGVSKVFVPYRPNYDLVCSTLASVTKITQTVNASYTLISNLTYTSTPNTIARIAAIAMNTGKVPTGIIISRSNQASQFENASNLIAKSEASYDCRQLQTDAIVTDGSATTYYIWAKVSEANSTMVKLVTQKIGYMS